MADTINITCTQCGNASRVPASAAGKKIRCKQCNAVFVVQATPAKAAPKPSAAKPPAAKAPAAAPAPAKAPAAKAPAAKPVAKPAAKPEEEDEYTAAKTAYIMRQENLAA